MPDGSTNSPSLETGQFKIRPLPPALTTTAATFPFPSWKTILDLTCILLSMPLWLPVVLVLALWIKLASPGPVFSGRKASAIAGNVS
jgi:lipopolysaccharide/colanic/teichoic acid biosynthesis glycosyltransferase